MRFSVVPLLVVAWVQVLWPPMVPGQTKESKAVVVGSNKQTTSKDGGLQEVIAEGAGATPSEALKDAFRNAVRQVVGTVVDAETLVSNDEIVDDKVLTYSDGFIKTYDKVEGSEKKAGGIHRVKIKAKVERRSVVAKLKAANVAVKEVDGKGLFAEAVTKLEAEQDARELLKIALDGFPANIIKATVIGQPKLVAKDATSVVRDAKKVTVSIDVDIFANSERYESLQKRLSGVLRKVAVRQGRCEMETKEKTGGVSLRHGGGFTDFVEISPLRKGMNPIMTTSFVPFRTLSMKNDKKAFGIPWRTGELDTKTEMVVVLNATRSKTHDRSTWEWFHIVRPRLFHSSVEVSVSLLDSDERILAMDRFGLQQQPGLWLDEQNVPIATISPYWLIPAREGQLLSVTMHTTREMLIDLDDLKLVETIKCTVENLEVEANQIK